MFLRAKKAFFHHDWFFIWSVNADPYPSGLGLELVNAIPSEEREFTKWLSDRRSYFDQEIIRRGQKDEPPEKECDEEGRMTQYLPSRPFMEWTYTLDLDSLVFHVDSQPLFRLDHMPRGDLFARYVSHDSYGFRSYDCGTPQEYCYEPNYKLRAPPITQLVPPSYQQLIASPGVLSIEDLISLGPLKEEEGARIRLLEICVGQLMASNDVGALLRRNWLLVMHSRDVIDFEILGSILTFIHHALSPMIFVELDFEYPRMEELSPEAHEFWWPRHNVCVRVSTHLDDKNNLESCIGWVVDQVMSRTDVYGVVYGIAFSLLHCSIIRINKGDGGSFAHTEAMQFLPSFHATSPSTPGITALARLSHSLFNSDQMLNLAVSKLVPQQCDRHHQEPELFTSYKAASNIRLSRNNLLRKLPIEVLGNIASYLTRHKHLVSFAVLSASTKSACRPYIRQMRIGEYRIVNAVNDGCLFASGAFGAMTVAGEYVHIRLGQREVSWRWNYDPKVKYIMELPYYHISDTLEVNVRAMIMTVKVLENGR